MTSHRKCAINFSTEFGTLPEEVAKYFMDFLETDFHKQRAPKRTIRFSDANGLLGRNQSEEILQLRSKNLVPDKPHYRSLACLMRLAR